MLASLDTSTDDLGLERINSNSSQLEVGSLSLYSSQARGRPKGRKYRVIGLPAGEKDTTESNTFNQLQDSKKKMFIFGLLFTDEIVVSNVVLRRMKIKKDNLNHIKVESLPDVLASETIKMDIVQDYFEINAFNHLIKVIKRKRESTYWNCKVCENKLGTANSIECDKCLFWCHWICVNLTEEPMNDWFCPDCNKEKNKMT